MFDKALLIQRLKVNLSLSSTIHYQFTSRFDYQQRECDKCNLRTHIGISALMLWACKRLHYIAYLNWSTRWMHSVLYQHIVLMEALQWIFICSQYNIDIKSTIDRGYWTTKDNLSYQDRRATHRIKYLLNMVEYVLEQFVFSLSFSLPMSSLFFVCKSNYPDIAINKMFSTM